MRERSLNSSDNSDTKVKVGKLVLIHENSNRLLWKRGIISKLHPGVDGHVRSVDLKTSGGILTRPIVKLYPLELDVDMSVLPEDTAGGVSRPVRHSAVEASKKIQMYYKI